MVQGWENKKVLITVKTYPTPAWKGGEVICTAGITENGKWIRLFPIPFRFLSGPQQFSKYQWITASVRKSPSDPRKESHLVDRDSISVNPEKIDTTNYWQKRKDIVLPLLSTSLCDLQAQRDKNEFPTLGIIKPKIDSLTIESASEDWSAEELARLSQLNLIDDVSSLRRLEKIPYTFKYQFHCSKPGCTGHNMSCSDWEISEAYRTFRNKYGKDWESKLRDKFENGMINKCDTYFYVGTIHGHPNAWIVIGLFYPQKAIC